MADHDFSESYSHTSLSWPDNEQTSFNETALQNPPPYAVSTASAPEGGYGHSGRAPDRNSQAATSFYNDNWTVDENVQWFRRRRHLTSANQQRQPHPQQPQQFGISSYPSTSTFPQIELANIAPRTNSDNPFPQQVNSASVSFADETTRNDSFLGFTRRHSSGSLASLSSEETLPPETGDGLDIFGFIPADARNPSWLHPSAFHRSTWPQTPGGRHGRGLQRLQRTSSSSRPQNRSFATSAGRNRPLEQTRHPLPAYPRLTGNSSSNREDDRSTGTKRRRRNRPPFTSLTGAQERLHGQNPSHLIPRAFDVDVSSLQSSHNEDQLLAGTRISSTLRSYLGDEGVELLEATINPERPISSIVVRRPVSRESLFYPNPGGDVIFLSHLIPRKFDIPTRLQFLFIFNFRAPYVPLAVVQYSDGQIFELGNDLFEQQKRVEKRKRLKLPLGPNGKGWPTVHHGPREHLRALPVEIFEEIGSYLPRDQIQNMRFVNHEFEKKVSCLAFRTVVVPFKLKIYGGPAQEDKDTPDPKNSKLQKDVNQESQGEAIADSIVELSSETMEFGKAYNPKKDLQDGMRVFEEWGPEIKRFALTFEVAEETLIDLPKKAKYDNVRTFWGSYSWPHRHYSRYETAENLEQKADESTAMTHALSRLTCVTELGLSILSGLGWQNGPDQSDRARLFKTKPKVFGTQFPFPDALARYQTERWNDTIREESIKIHQEMVQNGNSGYFESARVTPAGEVLPRMIFRPAKYNSKYPPLMFQDNNVEIGIVAAHAHRDLPDNFVLQALHDRLQPRDGQQAEQAGQSSQIPHLAAATALKTERLVPNRLQVEQKEWLLEMEWAHGAFLSSFCLALLDNRDTFFGLSTLNIANISSKYLEKLKRDDIWSSLPNIENLTVLVSPDWRAVNKKANGVVSTAQINASNAQDLFRGFLSALFHQNEKIMMLKIGYTDGGEHATGMMARNKNIIAAPVFKLNDQHGHPAVAGVLEFKNLRVLTLTNCWLTPPAMEMFIKAHQLSCLEEITFDSVSLTAQPPTILPTASAPDTVSNTQAAGLPVAPGHSEPKAFQDWFTDQPRRGSWSDVLDHVTPGYGIAFQRHLRDATEYDAPPPLEPTNIRSVTFNSCGYVRLTNMTSFDQSKVPHVTSTPPDCLHYRFQSLQLVMLDGQRDKFLGQIVPVMEKGEMECLETVFGMTFGWGEDPKQYENREDGQPDGGSGRFSGTLRRVEEDK